MWYTYSTQKGIFEVGFEDKKDLLLAVLRIRDILVRIRTPIVINLLDANKSFFFLQSFLLFTFLRSIYIIF